MIKLSILREFVMSFPEVSEQAHFEKTSFRVKKKIFATYDDTSHKLCVKLSLPDQNVFASLSKNTVYPVPNKWGLSGWTFVECQKAEEELIRDILQTAYMQLAHSKNI